MKRIIYDILIYDDDNEEDVFSFKTDDVNEMCNVIKKVCECGVSLCKEFDNGEWR